LTVKSKYEASDSISQTVEVVPNSSGIEITCEKNCPPVTDVSKVDYVTYLRAKCLSNCRGINDQHYEWSIERDNEEFAIDYEKDTQFGRRGPKLFVFKNVFEPGNYKVKVQLIGLEKE